MVFKKGSEKFCTARNTDGRGSDGGVWVVVGCWWWWGVGGAAVEVKL